MLEIPDLLPLRVVHRKTRPAPADADSLDRLVIVVSGRMSAANFRGLPRATALQKAADRMRRRRQDNATVTLDNARGTLISIHRVKGDDTFTRLTRAREIMAFIGEPTTRRAAIYCTDGEHAAAWAKALLAAAGAAAFDLPSFRSKARKTPARRYLTLFGTEAATSDMQLAESRANNLARWLTALPPNILSAAAYIDVARRLAKTHDLDFELFDEPRLEQLGAGAFLAVAQGNATRDAGIVRLSYRPQGPATPAVALVGKGIVFDTGGTNLKPFKGMLDMHIDMEGSAVALAAGIALAELKVAFPFDVWLAITPNRLSPTAYVSQDVVTAANGTTIQVIHTDAEGRMVLADTLTLAAREKPGLLLDYATLTGTCVSALTSRYSGVFTNRPESHTELVDNGVECGERVWPFPLDADFDDALKSKVADVMQCSPEGSGDHILAARFLARFVPESTPWVHMDLSAGQCKGGLAHVPSDITGFGVRYTLALLLAADKSGGSIAALPR